MDSSSLLKDAVMRQVQLESNTANVRILMEKMNENCFERCVAKPGSSLSSGEQKCFTSCMEKYMSAWNQVNSAYIQRIKREQASL
ncbi:Putative mitochondrial import inner membrane translocase subunit TIM13 [Cryphonectria parasitica EP155]|uniref:Mitochondrial import inner membrane translocase subunit n=1 Tax=Cryphonectria parasitica (strain ATCC 38755 / EP155) TaxID=660469 RepID=A0A9P5CSR4_CRYP1|nr:Putative mitochondrial import inner membrane translocase subunit TIM13 [Cryphonectria parasitica EP155]KAF3769864.1 Putative mitochondrial import inner membrane translocase subunit TIM13 [Cryphonectria parasitica EP155]